MEKRRHDRKKLEAAKRFGLGYMGDGIYEVYVRNHVMQKGLTKPNQLHATATKFVSAKAQARLMQQMLEQETS